MTSHAGAQLAATASLLSDYRYRGITLSDDKPAVQAGLTFDDPSGAYAGLFASTVRLGDPVTPGVQGMAFAGYAMRVGSGVSLEAGGDYSTFGGSSEYDYGEVYVGIARDSVSARVYYAPRYFGPHASAWYAEVNATQPLIEPFRLVGHVGWLATQTQDNYVVYGAPGDQHAVDGRFGVSVDVAAAHVELDWVGISNANVAYAVPAMNHRNTVVLTVAWQF